MKIGFGYCMLFIWFMISTLWCCRLLWLFRFSFGLLHYFTMLGGWIKMRLKMQTKAYFFGSFLNHNIFLAIHELSHNLAFWTPVYNRWLGVFANLPFGVPMSVTSQKYHLEHHRCQGVDGIDMDIPNHTETYLVTNVASKSIRVMLQLFFYALQPLFLKPKPPGYRSSLIFLSDNPSCCHDLFWG